MRNGSVPRELLVGLRLTITIAALTLIYTLVITAISQVAFNANANGGLIMRNGRVVGAQLIGQSCPKETLDKGGTPVYSINPMYFQGRISYTVDASTLAPEPCNAANSAGSNLGPSNPQLVTNIKAAVAAYRAQGITGDLPIDLVTSDFTGFDPDLSEAAALIQAPMVARARSLDPARVVALVEAQLQGRILWVFGEPHINVLQLNLALDGGGAS